MAKPVHIPILRLGKPYQSVEKTQIVHHASGQAVAHVSEANSGLIVRDIARMDASVLDGFSMDSLIDICGRAADLFMTADLPLGDEKQSFDDYIRQLSATTGSPQALCRRNAQKIEYVLRNMRQVLAGLTRGFDLAILDRGYGDDDGRMLSWHRVARTFGAVLPSNSPGVHSLWIPAFALKTPLVVKPGREEPWSPWRIIQSLIAAGAPAEAFGFYPCNHAAAGEILRSVDRGMIFGDASTTRTWRNDRRIEVHGPGFSKVILGADASADFERHLDVVESSILANGGRSCINASSVWCAANADAIADALARRLAAVKPLPADHPDARLALFANPAVAERINAAIDSGLAGAEDVTLKHRGGPRLVREGRCAWLLPTIVRCPDRAHPLADREFLFPYASVIECPEEQIPASIGQTLVGTVIGGGERLRSALLADGKIDRLNFGPIPTWQLSWDQPHEGNLFELLYKQRSFQKAGAA